MSISGISGGQNSYAYYLTSSNAAANTIDGTTSSNVTSPFANLNLTASQQTSVGQTLEQLQSGSITSAQAQTQISSVLTPAQQSQLQQNLRELQTHRHHHHDSSSPSSSSPSSTDTDEFGIPTTGTGSSTGSIGDVAATFWAQSQTNGNT